MGEARFNPEMAPALTEAVPACQWSFNKTRRFHYISGDSMGLFHHPPSELLHQHVSIADDPAGSWNARLDRIFSGNTSPCESTAPSSEQAYALIHVPIHALAGGVLYAAGFAYRTAQPVPAERELELAALAMLRVIETERAHTKRFLHDVVAQCLSGTGLQLELLRLEIEARKQEPPSRAGEIQRALEEALQRVRAFCSEGETGIA
jgi:signal transduction histidine kinase